MKRARRISGVGRPGRRDARVIARALRPHEFFRWIELVTLGRRILDVLPHLFGSKSVKRSTDRTRSG